ncbi:MAG: bifunctional riboflavin kinase/FMN adenylyltransferase [Waddliaceae bacterium]|nr:bifunctional riboflavin kinase/FMN adenylyltransferase [Waddliaceae bacterium]
MDSYYDLKDIPSTDSRYCLLIGNFDGVHLGHQMLLHTLKEKASKLSCKTAVFSYQNHPSTVLTPETPTLLLSTSLHRVRLMESFGIDLFILQTFNREFASQTPKQFLEKLQKQLPFKHLILGYDSRIGKGREGKQETVEKLAKEMNFQVSYLPELKPQGKHVSSTHLRKLLAQGDFKELKQLLGRPYSILSKIIPGEGKGRHLGYRTANLDVSSLCLPPYGVYVVHAKIKDHKYKGIANLGVAPTMRKEHSHVCLEVHIFDYNGDMYGEEAEVTFLHYLRSEQTFASPEELKLQIKKDIMEAHRFLEDE